MVDVSIIIVSYNTRDLVLQCIASVIECMEQVTAGGRLSVDARAISRGYEIIVVDNASTDSSAATILRRFPEVRLIANDFNRGFAAANNQAIAVSQGRFLFFLNPDTLVRQNAITELMRFLNRYPRVGVATGKLINPDGSLQHSAFHFPSLWMELLDHFPFSQRLVNSALNGRYSRLDYRRPFEIDHPLGACMMVRREVVGRVGAFSEDFFLYCEEIDWCMRIKQDGWRIFYLPQAVVVHYGGQSTRQEPERSFLELWRSRLILFRKHYNPFYRVLAKLIMALGLWGEHARWAQRYLRGEISPSSFRARRQAHKDALGLLRNLG